MFGREYSNHPEILLSSFKQMNKKYKRIKSKNNLLQKIYLSLFGIPEIGFQLRSLYFSEILKEKLQRKKFKKILDAGSGIGSYTFLLAKEYPKTQIVGGEIDDEKIEFSKSFVRELKMQNVEFKRFDITKEIKRNDAFDLIVNIDVLEHIENYKNTLKNFYKLLTPGGYLYIHTPQPDQKRIFKSFKNWSHDDHVHEGYTPIELIEALKKLGFKIVVKKETFGFFGKLAWELNHMSFKKGFVIAGISYPFLFLLSSFDLLTKNNSGLGTAILAKKTN